MKNAKKKNGAAAKSKGRATLSAQQTIPYLSMHPDGVCKLPGGLYTKTVEYEDINYSVASTEDQTAIFSGWSSFLNYFDSSLPFQLSFTLTIKQNRKQDLCNYLNKTMHLTLNPNSIFDIQIKRLHEYKVCFIDE